MRPRRSRYSNLAGSPADHTTFPLVAVLTCAASEIAVWGWKASTGGKDPVTGLMKPRPDADGPSTKDSVLKHFLGSDEQKQLLRRALLDAAKEKGIDLFSDDFKAGVKNAIEWAQTARGNSDYDARIRWVTSVVDVPVKDFGVAVSVIHAYQKHIEKSITSPSEFIGEPGDSVDLEVNVIELKEMTFAVVAYGSPNEKRTLVKGVIGGTEDIVSWWTKEVVAGLAVGHAGALGDRLRVKGRIKEHKMFGVTKETQLHFVKFERI